MPNEINFAARPLAAPRKYAAYQFYARMAWENHTPDQCFRYTALTVQNWLCERVENAGDSVPDGFQCPKAEEYASVDNGILKSVTGTVAGIDALPQEGIWSLWVREPDVNIYGRSYITHVGVRLTGVGNHNTDMAGIPIGSKAVFKDGPQEQTVEFGVRIDIVDLDDDIPEGAAYRPKFIRQLFQTPDMRVTQTVPLPFKNYISVGNKKELAGLTQLMTDPDNLMPCVIFTYAPEQVQTLSVEDFRRRAAARSAERQSPFTTIPLIMTSEEFTAPKRVTSKPIFTPKGKAQPTLPAAYNRSAVTYRDLPGVQSPTGQPGGDETVATDRTNYRLPYDVAEFARHTYGFCHVYVVAGDLVGELGGFLNKSIQGGDVLVAEPASFGGNRQVYTYDIGMGKRACAGITATIDGLVRRYSVHKPYRFGNILFDEAVRELIGDREIEEAIREYAAIQTENSTENENKLLHNWEQEHTRVQQLEQQMRTIQFAMQQEYQRGVLSEQSRNDSLQEQLAEAEARIAELEDKIDGINAGFEEMEGLRASLVNIRDIDTMPRTNEEVVNFFCKIYAEKIDFTEQGRRSAAKCDVSPEELWRCLYAMVTELYDIHRDNLPDVAKAFKERTGWDVAMSEGGQTRDNNTMMALRQDIYRGRAISIEPHVKFSRSGKKSRAAHQRLYYCYDRETRRIIVGLVGDHLDNQSALYLN